VFWKRREQAKEPSTSLFDPTKIDLISASPEGVVSLLIVQDQPWANTPDELRSLLQKLDNYVHFVVTGALATRDPSLTKAPWKILIDTHAGAPHDATIRALRERADALPADTLVQRSSKEVHELAAEFAGRWRWSSPDPGLGVDVELVGGGLHGVGDLSGVEKGLSGERCSAE
jgi:hypothetical protein